MEKWMKRSHSVHMPYKASADFTSQNSPEICPEINPCRAWTLSSTMELYTTFLKGSCPKTVKGNLGDRYTLELNKDYCIFSMPADLWYSRLTLICDGVVGYKNKLTKQETFKLPLQHHDLVICCDSYQNLTNPTGIVRPNMGNQRI